MSFNQVRAQRQDKIVAWQQDFDNLLKQKTPHHPEKESRGVSAFGSVRGMWPRRYDNSEIPFVHRPSISEAGETQHQMVRNTDDSLTTTTTTSAASDVSESEASPESPCPPFILQLKPDTLSTSIVLEHPIVKEDDASGSDSDSTIAGPRPQEATADAVDEASTEVCNIYQPIE